MPLIHEKQITCPYCGEPITILIDDSSSAQNYIEDCQVCCRPIDINVAVDAAGEISVTVRTDSA